MTQRTAQTEVMSEPLPASLSKPEGQERVVSFMHRLAGHPPQVLLLEGGSPEERLRLGLYWTAVLNCPASSPPCQMCPVCRQIQGQSYRDLFLFSGLEEQIKIDEVRHIRADMGQRPDQGPWRVIIFHQAQELTPSAANSLLKAMEEPHAGNVFVLLAPLRAWLLPTLVSRSLVLTLSWAVSRQQSEQIREWLKRLTEFWRTGRGLFEHSARKGEVSRALVQEITSSCQRSLLQAMQDRGGDKMAEFLARALDSRGLARLDLVLYKAHQALNLQTTPSLVLDWIAVEVWSMIHTSHTQ
ncbi:MAG: DNA polymerase III subunit delta' [Desulfovermiculus sp.]